MRDVARLAGVSQPTVSFVLNDRRDVSVAEGTRRRVLEAAKELNFRPNRMAQQLQSRKSYTLGIVTDAIASAPYAGRTVLGIQRAVRDRGYICMLIDTGGDREVEHDAVADLLDHGVAGVLYAPAHVQSVQPTDLLRGVRTVFVNCFPPDDFGGLRVLAAEYEGGRAAAEAVFVRGHRAVALLQGTPHEWAAVERKRGFLDAARNAGISDPLPILDGNFSIESGYDLTRELFRNERPTALVCGNDRMALGALLALHEMSLRVPEDVSLVGYDDQEDLARGVRPQFTTVALPHYDMGFVAGRLITDPDERVDHSPRMVACELIERDSVGLPPTRVRPAADPGRRGT